MSTGARALSRIAVRAYGSDPRLRGLSAGEDAIVAHLRARGYVATSEEGLERALARHTAGGDGAQRGTTVLLGDGVFDVFAGGISCPWPDLTLRGLGPGTVIRRTVAGTGSLLTFTGARVTLEDLVFDDQGGGTSQAAVTASGADLTLRRCRFLACGRGAVLSGARPRIQDCDVDACTGTDFVFRLSGTNTHAIVTGNHNRSAIEAGNGNFVWADDGISLSSFVANQTVVGVSGARCCVSYLTGMGNLDATNQGTVEVRPAPGAVP